MLKRVVSFLDKFSALSPCQNSFKKGKSTTTAIHEFLGKVYTSPDSNELPVGLFVDLSKAFDLVKHDILLEKLYNVGIRGVSLDWFRSYLENRSQNVYVCNKTGTGTSRTSHNGLGVP
jgi:hypothetical protein